MYHKTWKKAVAFAMALSLCMCSMSISRPEVQTTVSAASSPENRFVVDLNANDGRKASYAKNAENWNVAGGTSAETIQGDVNADGEFNIADVVLMQKWLLAVPDTTLANWKAGDLISDNKLDVFDLVMMKRELVQTFQVSDMIRVTDTETLKAALSNAKPGDEIVLASGEYLYSGSTPKGRMFTGEADGTENAPIIIRSEDPENPAILLGTTTESNYVLTITGDWWEIRDLIIKNASKGIILDNSNHTVIKNCELYQIGAEGIHIRDNSSYCTVDSCYVHDTGVVSPGYGEAVYVGSANGTDGYGFDCHYNTISNCKFGPNVAAEHIDVKEYTIGTVIENCTFDGTGISGENSAKSFVNIKGNDCILRNCIGYRNGCENITRAFEANTVVDGWGQNSRIYGNKAYMDTAVNANGGKMLFFNAWNCSATVGDNFMAYESGELFSVDDEATRKNYYNGNQLSFE